MNLQPFQPPYRAAELTRKANNTLSGWINIRHHPWRSLYAWESMDLYNNFGDVVGRLQENTVYLCETAPRLHEDLLHELGHAIARRFDLIGHKGNGYYGSWEQRQSRLIAQVRHGRYWSPLLRELCKNNRQEGNTLTPALGSEIWAEVFMFWFLYPDCEECELIQQEMTMLATSDELAGISELASRF